MGQQQGKQTGPPMPPPPMEGMASMPPVNPKPQQMSKIKGLKTRQNKADVGSWGSGAGQALGAGPPSVAVLGMFNELSNGKIDDNFILHTVSLQIFPSFFVSF